MPSGLGSTGTPPTAGPGWLTRLLVAALGLNVVLAWMAIQGTLVLAQAVWLAAAGHVFAGAEPNRIGRQLAMLRVAQLVAGLGAAGLFLAWVHRAHRTPGRHGPAGTCSARRAVLAFLVPGPNLVRPPRVVAALWRAGGGTPPGVTLWVAWWWGLSVAAIALTLPSVLLAGWSGPWPALDAGVPVTVLAECVRIGATVLTIVLVARIDRRLRDGRAEVPGRAEATVDV